MSYILHYAPDNASLIIRLALEHRQLPFQTTLVDRAAHAQHSSSYRSLNPNGLIPVLETPQGPIFETGAILLWLADTHGRLGPSPDAPERGNFLKWLFWMSNTLHPALRMLFYPGKYIQAEARDALIESTTQNLSGHFKTLNALAEESPPWIGAPSPTILDFYTCAVMRWPVLYPADNTRNWFRLTDYPALLRICAQIETLPCTKALQLAEGLGNSPFTAPQPPTPPEGSAT
ncbi:MAG: glutathione S-transferase family protein [Sulfitobacter sp.]